MKNSKYYLFTVLFSISLICFSQDGTLDISFGNEGIVTTDFYGERDRAFSFGQQSGNKTIVIGEIEINQQSQKALVRYLTNGEIDTTFGNNGVFNLDNPFEDKVFITNNDKIITAGNEDNQFSISRRLPNGNLDSSFGENGNITIEVEINTTLNDIIVQDDGKILVLGVHNSYKIVMLIKLLSNGELDVSFGDEGIATVALFDDFSYYHTFKVTREGEIFVLISNYFSQVNDMYLLKFLPNGELDFSFGEFGIVELDITYYNVYKNAFDIKNNGNIVLVSGINQLAIITQLLPNGNIDLSYGINGQTEISFPKLRPTKVLINSENKTLIYSQTWDNQGEGSTFELIRINENGSLDATFGENGSTRLSFESKNILLQNDGKIIGVGSTYWFGGNESFYLVRYHYNGTLSITENIKYNFIFYPNPSKGIYNITHGFINSETPYQISDITGKLIQQGNLSGKQTQINISQFENGVYLFTSEGSTFRLIKN